MHQPPEFPGLQARPAGERLEGEGLSFNLCVYLSPPPNSFATKSLGISKSVLSVLSALSPGLKTPVLRPHLVEVAAEEDLGPEAARVEEEQEIDLLEDEDEAIGDRIMEVAAPAPSSL